MFTAAQAAQKVRLSPCVYRQEFTAAQAAQKNAARSFYSPILFTAAQAAQKRACALRPAPCGGEVHCRTGSSEKESSIHQC